MKFSQFPQQVIDENVDYTVKEITNIIKKYGPRESGNSNCLAAEKHIKKEMAGREKAPRIPNLIDRPARLVLVCCQPRKQAGQQHLPATGQFSPFFKDAGAFAVAPTRHVPL